MREFVGWCCWFLDGECFCSDEISWAELAERRPDGLQVKMLYYADGRRQIQQGEDWYFEAPHESGEPIRGAGMAKDEIEDRYPGAVVIRGKWAPDGLYRGIVDEAMNSEWPHPTECGGSCGS